MQRNSNGPLGARTTPSVTFPASPGLSWRMHMSRIAMTIPPGRAPLSKPRG